jgi:hypothetical protein
MQNFIVHGFLGGITEMHPEFVGGGTDAPVNGGGFRPCWLNCNYICLPFLR